MEVLGEYIEGFDFPVCNSFTPKILDGELCYALNISSQVSESKAGRGEGLLLAIDNGISIEPHVDQNIRVRKDGFIRTTLKSSGKRARLRILTSHRHADSRPGKYVMKSLKVLAATDNFLAMPDDVKECQIETQEHCKSRRFVEEVKNKCGCIPSQLSSVAFDQVRQGV